MSRILLACYAYFLAMYPRDFRLRYGREMQLLLRDYAREHGSMAVGMFLFSDLLLSIPREHFREADMQRLITGAVGVLLLGFVGMHLIYDAQHQDVRMGFLLVLILTTLAIVGVYLLLRRWQPSRYFLWFIPAAYAAAASSFVLVTPLPVSHAVAPARSILMAIGQPAAIALLYLPVLIALLPIMLRRYPLMPTIATLLMLTYVVLATGMMATYFAPAAVAMVMVRWAFSAGVRQTAQ